jgi:hypothetical protein
MVMSREGLRGGPRYSGSAAGTQPPYRASPQDGAEPPFGVEPGDGAMWSHQCTGASDGQGWFR